MPLKLRYALAAVAALAAPLALTAPAFAEKPAVYTSVLNPVGAGGYDVVSYFKSSTPVKGSKDFTAEYKGVTWRFSSAANRDAFKADPAAFAPQYGGYCAWAVSQGYTAPGNPQHWSVVDGRLFLNYNAKVQKTWAADKKGFIAKSDAEWPKVLSK